MTAKRDVVAEIVAKRRRITRRATTSSAFIDRVTSLYDAIDMLGGLRGHDPSVRQELLNYVSVALVAAMEGYYRLVVRDLIDHRDPFRANAHRLTDLRLDVATFVGLQHAKVSIGELVAHMLPLSSMNDINRHMSTLLGVDYFSLLKQTRWRGDEKDTYGEAHARAWEAIDEIFKERHVVCHELGPHKGGTYKRATRHWKTVMILGLANEVLFETLLRPPTRDESFNAPAV